MTHFYGMTANELVEAFKATESLPGYTGVSLELLNSLRDSWNAHLWLISHVTGPFPLCECGEVSSLFYDDRWLCRTCWGEANPIPEDPFEDYEDEEVEPVPG